jgi:formate dehydrogenase subunit gamma
MEHPTEHGESPRRLPRFTGTERALHWTHAVTFVLLLATGAALLIPALGIAVGHHLTVLRVHLVTAIFYVAGPLPWVLFGDRSSLRRDVRAVDRWDDDDIEWLRTSATHLLTGDPLPPQGRFNAGQKLNAIFTAAATAGFAITGLIMWQTAHFPAWLLENAVWLHDTLAWVSAILWAGHVYLAALAPSTRPGLRGMLDGSVSMSWARHHHAKWVAEVEAEGERRTEAGPRKHKGAHHA